MNSPSTHIQYLYLAVLCTACAAWAYFSPNQSLKKQHLLLDATPAQLFRFEYTDEQSSVALEQKDETLWVKVETQNKPTQYFPASRSAHNLMKQWLPLYSPRVLENIPQETQKEMGLQKPRSRVSIDLGAGPKVFEFGEKTFGNNALYMRQSNGSIHLLKSSLLSPLKSGAPSLLDKRLFSFEENDIEDIQIRSSEKKTKRFLHRTANEQNFYALPIAPDEAVDGVAQLVNRALRLRVVESGVKGPNKKDKKILQITLQLRDANSHTLTIYTPLGQVALAESSLYQSPVHISAAQAMALQREADALTQ